MKSTEPPGRSKATLETFEDLLPASACEEQRARKFALARNWLDIAVVNIHHASRHQPEAVAGGYLKTQSDLFRHLLLHDCMPLSHYTLDSVI